MSIKNKILLFSLLFSFTTLPSFGVETLADVEFPKDPAYRVGISEIPEKQYIQALQDKIKKSDKASKLEDIENTNITDLTYADLSIKRLSKEIAQELEYEEQDMLADLSLLWQGAAMQSDTINFALYKLANPDADKPDEKSIRNVLKTIASMSTLVGASMGSPIIAGSSLIGGNIFGIMSQDTKALNYKYTRVNDADMIILIRKVEDLQQKAVDLYYDYMSAKKQLEFANELVKDRQRKFELAQKNNAARELVVITDAYYRTALDRQRTAKSEFFSKRAALEQFVGNETFIQFETELAARERGETTKTVEQQPQKTPEQIAAQETEYEKTVEDVKAYTENISTESENPQNNIPTIRGPETISEEELAPIKAEEQKTKKQFFWNKKENNRKTEETENVVKKEPKTEKIKKEKVKIEKPKKEKVVKEKKISTPTASNKPIKLEKLEPLSPITTEDYAKTISELEQDLKDSEYEVYDFSDTYSKRYHYIGDPMYDGMTGLAANVSEKKSTRKKDKKEKVKEEKPKKEKKEKVDPKSTKNLIFLHGESKQSAKSRFNFNVNGREAETNNNQPTPQPQNYQQTRTSEFNFLPLDEIKAPDLTKEGYSIHSEYMY